ncbi:MAG: hypothetical protein ACK4UP_10730 [Spirosomataceae bacterium]
MTQTCTQNPNDVIRYLYNETTSEENEKMEALLMTDPATLDLYLDCVDLMAQLNKIQYEPSVQTIHRILDFSKEYVAK